MFVRLLSEFMTAADPAGSEHGIPIDTAFIWRRGLTLRALEPVAICVPVPAPSAGTTRAERAFLFDAAVSEGVTEESPDAAATHNYFLAAGNIARARREIQVTFKTPGQTPARFMVVQDTVFEY